MRSCDRYTCTQLEKVSFAFGGKIYQDNIKYCKLCDIFLKIDGYRCYLYTSSTKHANDISIDNQELVNGLLTSLWR